MPPIASMSLSVQTSVMPTPSSSHPTTPTLEDEKWVGHSPVLSSCVGDAKDLGPPSPALEQRDAAVPTLEKGGAGVGAPDGLPPTDGGFAAWSVVAGAAVALFVQFGLGNSFGTFQQYVRVSPSSGAIARPLTRSGRDSMQSISLRTIQRRMYHGSGRCSYSLW